MNCLIMSQGWGICLDVLHFFNQCNKLIVNLLYSSFQSKRYEMGEPGIEKK